MDNFAETLDKHKVPIIIGGSVIVIGIFLFSKFSGGSSSSSSNSSGASAALGSAYLKSQELGAEVNAANFAAQQQTQQAALATQAIAYQSAAQTSAYNDALAASEYGDNRAAQAALGVAVLKTYGNTQLAAYKYAEANNLTNAREVTNMFANVLQYRIDSSALRDAAALQSQQISAMLMKAQDADQAYTSMAQSQSLAQQNIAGNNSLSQANQSDNNASDTFSSVLSHMSFSGGGYSASL